VNLFRVLSQPSAVADRYGGWSGETGEIGSNDENSVWPALHGQLALPAGGSELAGHAVQVDAEVAPRAAEDVPATRARSPAVSALTPSSYMITAAREGCGGGRVGGVPAGHARHVPPEVDTCQGPATASLASGMMLPTCTFESRITQPDEVCAFKCQLTYV